MERGSQDVKKGSTAAEAMPILEVFVHPLIAIIEEKVRLALHRGVVQLDNLVHAGQPRL
jgi:hypothetical protein